jgi:rhodanese-related sulfurtransferase
MKEENMKEVMIDVREREEFAREHIADSINIPLSALPQMAPGILKNISNDSLVIMCRSGTRAMLAKGQLQAMGTNKSFKVFEGGILEWKNQNKDTVSFGPSLFPIMRQVQIVAGSLILLGTLLAWLVNLKWLLLSGGIGLGLAIAGFTGFCGMANLLMLMPWNKKYAADSN